MAAFLSHDLAELTRQFTYAPPQRRRQQIDRAEDLYWRIDPERNYPLDFIVYGITQYRPDTTERATLVGEAVRKDLLLMVERLSGSLDERADRYDPPPYDQPALSKRLGVSTKTISRYRRDGLFARRLIFSDGRKRLAFLPGSVERFLASRPADAKKAANFSRIDEETRHRIITRARRITSRVETSPFRVAQHLGRKFHRSTEAIRLLLLKHDRHDPRVAIFRSHTPPLTEKQQRIIHRAYHRGVPVARLAQRFGKARNAIYRSINRRRALALHELEIRYVHSPTFDLPDAEEVILGSALPDAAPGGKTSDEESNPIGKILPIDAEPARGMDALALYLDRLHDSEGGLDAETEKMLFVRYNYLKHRAARLREQLDRHQPRSGRLDRIETYLRRAVAIKHRLVRAHLRLVVSVARKHLGGRGFDPQAMADLVGEGNVVLLETIETFDAGRGNRFSTYLTWALMRRFARADRSPIMKPAVSIGSDGQRGEYWPTALNPNLAAMEHAEHVTHTLTHLLSELDERERVILSRRFGLSDPQDGSAAPQTLAEIAAEVGLSAERVRQIERRAIRKLREVAGRLGLARPAADVIPAPSPRRNG